MKKSIKFALLNAWGWMKNQAKASGGLGFPGPTPHYWHDELMYVGNQYGWVYDTLIEGMDHIGWYDEVQTIVAMIKSAWDGRHFNHGSFEYSWIEPLGGTPHEACLAHGLLRANELEIPLSSLMGYHKSLYDPHTKTFKNKVYDPTQVPNKNASICEAFLKLDETRPELNIWLPDFGAITDFICKLQQKDTGGIWQGTQKTRLFSLYTARCIPFLLRMGCKQEARRAGQFLEEMRLETGGFRWGLCIDHTKSGMQLKDSPGPILVAGCAEIIHALKLLKRNYVADLCWLLKQQHPTGAFPYAQRSTWIRALPSPGWMFPIRLLAKEIKRCKQRPLSIDMCFDYQTHDGCHTYHTKEGIEVFDRHKRLIYRQNNGRSYATLPPIPWIKAHLHKLKYQLYIQKMKWGKTR